jgi:UDP-N-acetylglucosamine acyltransferase
MPIDPSAQVAPTARVHPGAIICPGVVIGDFAIVEEDVVVGTGSRLEPYVYVKRWTTLGERNQISAGTVLGTNPLDKGFTGARSYLKIGNGNVIREHYTISRGTAPESETVIGDENYIMTSGHIAHNCRIGSHNHRQLRTRRRLRGSGGSSFHLRRRGDPSVFAYRELGNGRGQHARE